MGTFSALLPFCVGNSPVTGEFPSQRPVTRSFDVFFDLCLNKRLSKQSRGCWFKMTSRSIWRHCNGNTTDYCQLAATNFSINNGGQIRHTERSITNCNDTQRLKKRFGAVQWCNTNPNEWNRCTTEAQRTYNDYDVQRWPFLIESVISASFFFAVEVMNEPAVKSGDCSNDAIRRSTNCNDKNKLQRIHKNIFGPRQFWTFETFIASSLLLVVFATSNYSFANPKRNTTDHNVHGDFPRISVLIRCGSPQTSWQCALGFGFNW